MRKVKKIFVALLAVCCLMIPIAGVAHAGYYKYVPVTRYYTSFYQVPVRTAGGYTVYQSKSYTYPVTTYIRVYVR